MRINEDGYISFDGNKQNVADEVMGSLNILGINNNTITKMPPELAIATHSYLINLLAAASKEYISKYEQGSSFKSKSIPLFIDCIKIAHNKVSYQGIADALNNLPDDNKVYCKKLVKEFIKNSPVNAINRVESALVGIESDYNEARKEAYKNKATIFRTLGFDIDKSPPPKNAKTAKTLAEIISDRNSVKSAVIKTAAATAVAATIAGTAALPAAAESNNNSGISVLAKPTTYTQASNPVISTVVLSGNSSGDASSVTTNPSGTQAEVVAPNTNQEATTSEEVEAPSSTTEPTLPTSQESEAPTSPTAETTTPTAEPTTESDTVPIPVVTEESTPTPQQSETSTPTAEPSTPASETPVQSVPTTSDVTQPELILKLVPPFKAQISTVDAITGEVLNNIPNFAKPTAKQNEKIAESVTNKLLNGYTALLEKLPIAIKSGSLNSLHHADGDKWSTPDPRNPKVTLKMSFPDDLKAKILGYKKFIEIILANDETRLNELEDLLTNSEFNNLDAETKNLITKNAENTMVEKGQTDLTKPQKIAFLTVMALMNKQLEAEADKQIKIATDQKLAADAKAAEEAAARAQAEAEAAAAAPAPTTPRPGASKPESVNNSPDYRALSDSDAKRYKENIPKIWNFLLDEEHGLGLNTVQAAGFMGNIYQESRFNPALVESNGEGIGFIQWSFERKALFLEYCKNRNKSWKDINTQLAYIKLEMTGRYKEVLTDLKNAKNLEQAMYIVLKDYESPGNYDVEGPRRLKMAKEVFNVMTARRISRQIITRPNRPSITRNIILPRNIGDRSVNPSIANSAGIGESIYGPNDPCSKVMGNKRALCIAQKFFGIRYAEPGQPKWEDRWGTEINSSSGHGGPIEYVIENRPGSANDFIDCSGLVNVAFGAAFNNKTIDNCSAGFLDDTKNWKEINIHDIEPGDIVIASRVCGGSNGGHVGIVATYDPKTKKLRTYESSAGKNDKGKRESGLYSHRKIGKDYKYAARYIGPGSDYWLRTK